MPFAYLRDPLFLTCFAAYWINRFVIKPLPHPAFFHESFNDLICIPFLLPILLSGMRLCRLRWHDDPPTTIEIVVPVIVWSVQFEILAPQDSYWSHWVTGDPMDVLWYCVGAAVASIVWQCRYRAIAAP